MRFWVTVEATDLCDARQRLRISEDRVGGGGRGASAPFFLVFFRGRVTVVMFLNLDALTTDVYFCEFVVLSREIDRH